MASRSVYCICGEPYDSTRFMIQCDSCKDWYHGSCVDVKEHESIDIERYHCVQCQPMCGPSIYREVKNFHRHDYNDSTAESKAVQSGTMVFIKELKSRHFLNGEDIVLRLRGPTLNLPYLMQNGFNLPILVDSKIGLGLQMPSETFTVSDVMDYIGPDFNLDIIDVRRQENIKMTMKEWVEYFNSTARNKVYNVISLEFSKTRLTDVVKPPTIIQKLSWVENFWPKLSHDVFPVDRPEVMKYCLMSTRDSYTDFHIDFGGTSVWYHILRGEKVFFLIRPTPANLALYEHWMASSNQSETFFGDQVDACYQLILTQGQTLFIPTGWIHSVFTPVDSLVFGGNFLHSMNIPLQLQIHEMEKRICTPEKFKFPSFETVHWFAAPHILEQLKDFNVSKRELQHFIVGAKALVSVLRAWSSDSQTQTHEDVPPGINVSKLIKDLQREVRSAEKFSSSKNMVAIPIKKPPPRLRKQKDMGMMVSSNDMKPLDMSQHSKKAETSTLKFSYETNLMSTVDSKNHPVQTSVPISVQHLEASAKMFPKFNYNYNPSLVPQLFNPAGFQAGTLPDRNDFLKYGIPMPADMTQNMSSPSAKNDSVYDFVDSDDDTLVVDESPPNRSLSKVGDRHKTRVHDGMYVQGPGGIKLRLSINGKPIEEGMGKPLQNDDGSTEVPKNSTIDALLMATELAVDADNSISLDDDDLSGGRTSPSTREAIQGMLSISKSAFLFTNQGEPKPNDFQASANPLISASTPGDSLSPTESSVANFSILAKKSSPQSRPYTASKSSRTKKRFQEDDDDFEESLKQCHQDSDYIYLGLEASDDDFPIFKTRGKSRVDEPWNPRVKLLPNCPKPERPVREGVRKEAIETGLAVAAAKLATMPPPKRPHFKKKLSMNKNKESPMKQAGPSLPNKRPSAAEVIKASKKPKKGFATPKQRLGKILKIHKMLY